MYGSPTPTSLLNKPVNDQSAQKSLVMDSSMWVTRELSSIGVLGPVSLELLLTQSCLANHHLLKTQEPKQEPLHQSFLQWQGEEEWGRTRQDMITERAMIVKYSWTAAGLPDPRPLHKIALIVPEKYVGNSPRNLERKMLEFHIVRVWLWVISENPLLVILVNSKPITKNIQKTHVVLLYRVLLMVLPMCPLLCLSVVFL